MDTPFLGAALSVQESAALISHHFNQTLLPRQTFATYEALAKKYWEYKDKGYGDKAIIDMLELDVSIFISGDALTVAAGVVTAMNRVARGDRPAASSTPSWNEVLTDYGITPGAWYTTPLGLVGIAAGIVFLPGMLGRFFRGAR